jgi:hypothetical protein
MLTRYGASARSARARRTYDRIILFQHHAEFAANVEAFLSDPGQGGKRANQLTLSTMRNRAAPLIIRAKAAAASASPKSTERTVRGSAVSRNDDRGCRP